MSKENIAHNRHLLNGAGVATGDVDGDCLADIYFCKTDGPNVLYRNLGGWKFEDITDKDIEVIQGLISQKLDQGLNDNQLLLGIDPGKQIGLSVYYLGNEISSSFFVSTEKLIQKVISILAELKAKHKIIKIGNGDMQMANEIAKLLNLKFCSSFEIEFVDERNTSLKIKNFNQRGKRDMLSAQFITQRSGYWHSVLPLSITG